MMFKKRSSTVALALFPLSVLLILGFGLLLSCNETVQEEKNITELSTELQTLIDRARNKQLVPEEYSGATFSISNLGMYPIDNFIAVLVPPQAASLAIGAIQSVGNGFRWR